MIHWLPPQPLGFWASCLGPLLTSIQRSQCLSRVRAWQPTSPAWKRSRCVKTVSSKRSTERESRAKKVLGQVQLTWLTHEKTSSHEKTRKRTTRVPCSEKKRTPNKPSATQTNASTERVGRRTEPPSPSLAALRPRLAPLTAAPDGPELQLAGPGWEEPRDTLPPANMEVHRPL